MVSGSRTKTFLGWDVDIFAPRGTVGDKWSQRWLRIAPLNYTIRKGARMERIGRVVLEDVAFARRLKRSILWMLGWFGSFGCECKIK